MKSFLLKIKTLYMYNISFVQHIHKKSQSTAKGLLSSKIAALRCDSDWDASPCTCFFISLKIGEKYIAKNKYICKI